MATYIIAEAACEHQGNIVTAEEMVKQAKVAGADCVKFQRYNLAYQPEKLQKILTQGHLYIEHHIRLKKLAESLGIDYLCSAFDRISLEELAEIGCKSVKIPSPTVGLIEPAMEMFETVIASTGMHSGNYIPIENLKVLQCTSAYPCPYDQVNLKAMKYCNGLSDHTLGWEVPVAAVAMGAEIIEKHFTLDKMNGGPDAHMSLDPREFGDMVRRIRNVEMAMGDGVKKIEESERKLLWRKKFI